MYSEVYINQKVRKEYKQLLGNIGNLSADVIKRKKSEAEDIIRNIGITFSVYSNTDMTEHLIPFDMFPRIISASEWKKSMMA